MTDNSHSHGGAFIGWGAVAVAIALLFNLIGLVWGAATIKATVDNLEGQALEFRAVVSKMQDTQASIVTELAIVADRQDYMQLHVDDHNERLDKMESK